MKRAATKRQSTPCRVAFFVVSGRPVTQGSLVAFRHRSTGRIVSPQKAELVAWRRKIATLANTTGCYLAKPLDVEVELVFWLERGQRADLDKLARAVLDALTGVIFEDDVQVVYLHARKRIAVARGPHVTIHVQEAPVFPASAKLDGGIASVPR